MYLSALVLKSNIPCPCHGYQRGLSGLASAQGDNLLRTGAMMAAEYYSGGSSGALLSAGGQGGGGSDGSGGSSSSNTNTNVVTTTTTISPQISPNFIQQQQPTNSAVNATTTQSNPLPFTPATGAIPGFDTIPQAMPTSIQTAPESKLPIILGIAALAGVLLLKKRKTASTPIASA